MKWYICDGKLEGTSFEEAGAEIIQLSNGVFELYEITQYGAATIYYNVYTTLQEAMYVAEGWT